MNFARTHLAVAFAGFALGAAAALSGVWLLGTPRTIERVVEVEKVVEKLPAPAPPRPGRADLVVVQGGKSVGLTSDFSDFLVEEARAIPEVERVSEAVVDVVNVTDASGAAGAVLLQGWKPDNFGYEGLELLSGRLLRDGDTRKLTLGNKLAASLNKKVGDRIVFGDDQEHSYEVVGVFRSAVNFENGGAVAPLEDAQALTGKRVTGFSVRVRKTSPDAKAEVEAVRRKIEALRDPKEPNVRLAAETPDLN